MSTEKKKIVPTDAAYPSFAEIQEDRDNDKLIVHGFDGIDIRTKIATDIMSAMIASGKFTPGNKETANQAVEAADMLIESLNGNKAPF